MFVNIVIKTCAKLKQNENKTSWERKVIKIANTKHNQKLIR
jgi:hypothetical protein